jgi:D-alanyl-D-alanine carboxypeptidase
LLQEEGFTGLKTGWTNNAAYGCLAATYKNKNTL